jgi:phage terminase large subunit
MSPSATATPTRPDEVEVSFPYVPRGVFGPYHERSQRWAAMVAHRRAGKTVACINDVVASAVSTNKPRARYSYIAPYYSQAKQIAWDYLKYYAEPASGKTSESELSVCLPHNGATVRLYGADNADAMRGVYNDGVILDEYGMMKPSVWSAVVLPTLADRKGWATFIGTPNGKNHFYEIVSHAIKHPREWFHLELKASRTHILSEFELQEQRRLMDEDEYAQEYECSFDAAIRGAVYGKEMRIAEEEGRMTTSYAIDASQPIHAVADLGFHDDTAFWFWQTRPDGFLLTYTFSDHFKPIEDYINKLLMLPNLGEVWLPHDARAKSLQTGKSIVEQFLHAGIRPRIVPLMAVHDGIAAARKILPHCYFALPGTQDGVEALKQYQRPWDEDIKTYREKPLHDWTSHYADAFRYFALIVRPHAPKVIAIPDPAGTQYNLENLFADRDNRRTLVRRI